MSSKASFSIFVVVAFVVETPLVYVLMQTNNSLEKSTAQAAVS